MGRETVSFEMSDFEDKEEESLPYLLHRKVVSKMTGGKAVADLVKPYEQISLSQTHRGLTRSTDAAEFEQSKTP